jgi:hypothetical protein
MHRRHFLFAMAAAVASTLALAQQSPLIEVHYNPT